MILEHSMPIATYRLQLNKNFTFYHAAEILDYLCDLGISHLYLSPVLESMPDSNHGYDVTDFSKISSERGGEEGLLYLDECMAEKGLRLILDIVPNHMAAHKENPYWYDVQKKGRDSPYWHLFDIRTVEDGKIRSYRRFFAIDDLIGIRVEDPNVFTTTHKKIVELSHNLRTLDGVRVDHIDGLADPAGYLRRLRRKIPKIWVEKILTKDETIPPWPVHGTTGYDFINITNNIFINKDNFKQIENFWHAQTCPPWKNFESCTIESRNEILFRLFPPELTYILSLMPGDKGGWDFLSRMVALPVYRTYISGRNKIICAWQQLSSALFAKGIEDTAHYRYTPLLAMNEVGCDVSERRDLNCNHLSQRAITHPYTMNTTSTHDTKRSEDVRSRLYSLADDSHFWPDFYKAAESNNKKFIFPSIDRLTTHFLYQTLLAFYPVCRNQEPDFRKRLHDYMIKSMRERHENTGWDKPNESYENALSVFIDRILDDEDFIARLEPGAAIIAQAGAINALSVLIMKVLSGGIPDFYQGSENWYLALVDPDNRRPADFKKNRQIFLEMRKNKANDTHQNFLDYIVNIGLEGPAKIWLTERLLSIKKSLGGIPLHITEPISTIGPHKDHIFACTVAGPGQERKIHIILPLYPRPLLKVSPPSLSLSYTNWGETAVMLENNDYVCLLQDRHYKSNKYLKIQDIFIHFPAAILTEKRDISTEPVAI